jgi:hypothetical protein
MKNRARTWRAPEKNASAFQYIFLERRRAPGRHLAPPERVCVSIAWRKPASNPLPTELRSHGCTLDEETPCVWLLLADACRHAIRSACAAVADLGCRCPAIALMLRPPSDADAEQQTQHQRGVHCQISPHARIAIVRAVRACVRKRWTVQVRGRWCKRTSSRAGDGQRAVERSHVSPILQQ